MSVGGDQHRTEATDHLHSSNDKQDNNDEQSVQNATRTVSIRATKTSPTQLTEKPQPWYLKNHKHGRQE